MGELTADDSPPCRRTYAYRADSLQARRIRMNLKKVLGKAGQNSLGTHPGRIQNDDNHSLAILTHKHF
jgi:hypothetical protein